MIRRIVVVFFLASSLTFQARGASPVLSVTTQVQKITAAITPCDCKMNPFSRDAGDAPLGRTTFKDLHGTTQTVSVVNDEYALKLFQEMTVQNKIPFGFPEDGCFARAHEMSYQLQEKGIFTGKVFAIGQFRVASNKALKGAVTWGFHVAPFLIVNSGKGEEIWVIDPSLFYEPISLQNWLEKLTAQPKSKLSNVYLASRFIYHPSNKDLRLTKFRATDLDAAHRIMRHYLQSEKKRELQKSPDL